MPLHFFASSKSAPSQLDKRTYALGRFLPVRSKVIHKPQADVNLESPFFAKLPPEVRQLIYAYVLGGARFHVYSPEQTLFKRRCRAESRYCYRCPRRSEVAHWSELAFLLTCRQVYSESVNILYSANLFAFASPDTFNLFTTSIQVRSRNIIRRLHITHRISWYTLDFWRRCCQTIANMPALEELYIQLLRLRAHGVYSDSDVLDPIKVISGVRDFEVKLTWTTQYNGISGLPFRLTGVQRQVFLR